jgi:hypothetical protein
VAQPLEPAAIASRHGDVGVEAHAAVLGNTGRGLGIGVAVLRLDAIAEAPPTLPGVGAARDAGAQRCAGQRGEQGLVAGKRVVVALGARLEPSHDPARGAGEHPRHLGAARRGQGQEARRLCPGPRVDPVEDQRVEVQVRIQGGAEALDEGHGAALAAADAPAPSRAPAELGEERA